MSEAKAATALLGLSPTEAKIPEETAANKAHFLPMKSLLSLQLVVLLLTPKFLPSAASYTLAKTRVVILQLTEAVK